MNRKGLLLILVAASSFISTAAEVPAAGETELNAADRDARLVALTATFTANPCVKARIVTEVEDLVGTRTEEGELLLDRPARMLRRFTKPSAKFWYFGENQLTEYAAKTNTAYVKDFAKAPKMLSLLQAAIMMDFKKLDALFELHVFESSAGLRLVLAKKPGENTRLPYKRIQARLAPGGILFHELEYLPDDGDRTVEKYLDIQPVAAWPQNAFELNLPADAKRQISMLTDGETK